MRVVIILAVATVTAAMYLPPPPSPPQTAEMDRAAGSELDDPAHGVGDRLGTLPPSGSPETHTEVTAATSRSESQPARGEPSQRHPRRCTHPHPCGDEWPDALEGPFDLGELRTVRVESFDGTQLEGWIGLPDLPEGVRAPVALHSSPYLGACIATIASCIPGPGSDEFWGEDPGAEVQRTWGVAPIELVRRGYAAAFFSLRGTGGSGGCADAHGLAEQRDQVALVEWLAGQSWSNGRVGMGGNSWPGTTPWEAAIYAPEALKTIVTAGIVSDYYTFFHTPQGAAAPIGGLLNPTLFAETSLLPHLGNGPGQGAEETPRVPDRLCPGSVAVETEPISGQYRGVRDASTWVPRRMIDRYPDVTAAVLLAQGLQDTTGHAFQESAVWSSTPNAPKWQIAGQWGHGPPFAEEPALTPEWIRDNWPTILFDWLDYWLKGIGPRPPTGRVDYQDSGGDWHTTGAWPPAEVREEVLYLVEDALSPKVGEGSRSFRAARSTLNDYRGAEDVAVPSSAWSAVCRNRLGEPADTAGVAYVSDPVAEPTLIAGNPFAYLTVESDQAGGVFAVHVLRTSGEVDCADPSASLDWLATGAADLRHHDGRYVGRDFPVGRPTGVRVDIYDLAERLEAGDRLVLVVNGDEDFFGHAGEPQYSPVITVHAGRDVTASHVVLPVVEGTLHGSTPTLSYPPRPFVPQDLPSRSPRRPR